MIASERSEPIFRIWRWKHAILLSVLLVNIFVGTISPRVGSSMLVILMMALLMTIYTDKLETGDIYIYIFFLFKIITFVRTFIRYTD